MTSQTPCRPLRQLAQGSPFGTDNAPIVPIAYGESGGMNGQQLNDRSAAWERSASVITGSRVALYVKDTVEFTAALLALWRMGKTPVIPPNNLPHTVEALTGYTSAFMGDFAVANCIRADAGREELASDTVPGSGSDCALVIFTSGSSGDPTPVEKSFAQLDAEIATLESQWGARLGSAVITGTVTHHHIYGLLFTLLWPLATGRPILHAERDYWEEIHADCKHFSSVAIISSPAHLSRMPHLDWSGCQNRIAAVFSSGAALPQDSAIAAEGQLGQPITEVYGSTETGAIAWRQQTAHSGWQPFPPVQLRMAADTQQLQVRSPFLPPAFLPDKQWLNTNDRVQLNSDHTFTLLHRVDRIAKVAGKRISLDIIERQLRQHPWITEAAIVLLASRSDRLGAVVVLNGEGSQFLIDQGKQALNEVFKTSLENTVERVALPRYWRYLPELPHNQQGKVVAADLQSLFAPDSAQPTLPELVQRAEDSDNTRLALRVPANLYYFNGHFPGRPIVPGVAQIHWAIHYARERWGHIGDFLRLEAVKFQHVIMANEHIELTLHYQREKQKILFSFSGKPGNFSSGRILFSNTSKRETGSSSV